MKHDPAVYRARLEGMRPMQGKLNMPVPGAFDVEIYQDGPRWKARYAQNRAGISGIRSLSHLDCQAAVELMFQKIIEPWERIDAQIEAVSR